MPMRGGSSGVGEADAPVTFDGLSFIPGDILCMDADGVVIVPAGLLPQA
jgi:regulator of RNase E activity RraA